MQYYVRGGQAKGMIEILVAFVVLAYHLEAKSSRFINDSDSLTTCLDLDFLWTTTTSTLYDRWTDRLLYPLHMHTGVITTYD